ncbi:MAG: DoxX family protein [Plesiomonas sp.]|uniref:DoxX family protein n=1 Tax=Plesiomonas sp. TaxID=2486279 RepID=UPI003F40370D
MKYIDLLARIMMAYIFIIAGWGKLGVGYAGVAGHMQSVGLPGILLPLVILLELGGGLALLIGFHTRFMAAALALFCIMSGILFHYQPTENMQMTMLMKNIAMAGGLLMWVQHGAAALSWDAYRSRLCKRKQ